MPNNPSSQEKLNALNHAIDWELLEAFGYQGPHDFESPIPSEQLPSIDQEVYCKDPKIGSSVHLWFWAADTGPIILSHLLRLCKEWDYPIQLNQTYVSEKGTIQSLMYYIANKLPPGEYLEYLAHETQCRKSGPLSGFVYERMGLGPEKVILMLLENGVSPNGQGIEFSRYSNKIWEAVDKQGYDWGSEKSLRIGRIISPRYKIATRRWRMAFLMNKGATIDHAEEVSFEHDYSYLQYLIKPSLNFPTILLQDLMKAGANLHRQSQTGQNAWHHLCESLLVFRHWNQNHTPIPKHTWFRLLKPMLFLKKYNVDINLQNHEGQTPLHVLAKTCKAKDVAWILMHLGADPSIQDHQGKTAFTYAYEHGHIETAETLYAVQSLKDQEAFQDALPGSSSAQPSKGMPRI